MTLRPEEIEAKSFEIIDSEVGTHPFPPDQWPIVRRAIHATADLDLVKVVRFHPEAVARGIEALRRGARILVDVEMIRAGINKKGLERLGGGAIECYISEPEVVEMAKKSGGTRAAAAMRWAKERLPGSIVAIGNAPTALLELAQMIEEGASPPALVVGVPVGFVSAAESKEKITETQVPYVIVSGRKGGSTVAVAMVNALIKLALEEK